MYVVQRCIVKVHVHVRDEDAKIEEIVPIHFLIWIELRRHDKTLGQIIVENYLSMCVALTDK
uniref:Uncharacterized protein n=1 Tax=Romanomermis culicivorax TaxID=13658 RepID=A0A915L0W1_ROMCU